MRRLHRSVTRAGLLAALLSVSALGCGDSGEAPTVPSSAPPPAPSSASLTIENFTATVTTGLPTYSYRVVMRLRESNGVAATVTAIRLTLTQTGGGTISTDIAPNDAFESTTVPANGTLSSRDVSFSGPPVAASQLAARVTYTDANGNAGTAQATTNVVTQ